MKAAAAASFERAPTPLHELQSPDRHDDSRVLRCRRNRLRRRVGGSVAAGHAPAARRRTSSSSNAPTKRPEAAGRHEACSWSTTAASSCASPDMRARFRGSLMRPACFHKASIPTSFVRTARVSNPLLQHHAGRAGVVARSATRPRRARAAHGSSAGAERPARRRQRRSDQQRAEPAVRDRHGLRARHLELSDDRRHPRRHGFGRVCESCRAR